MTKIDQYAIVVMPLSDEDGGGFVARVPDLPGCMGDGATPEKAVADARKAILEWVTEYAKIGREVPEAGSHAAELRKRREAELATLNELFAQLHDSQRLYANLDDRIAAIEAEMRNIVEMVNNLDHWDYYQIITKSIRPAQPQLALC